MEVLLHALVVLELTGDRDGQRLTVVSIINSRELSGPVSISEKRVSVSLTLSTGTATDSVTDKLTRTVCEENKMSFIRGLFHKF